MAGQFDYIIISWYHVQVASLLVNVHSRLIAPDKKTDSVIAIMMTLTQFFFIQMGK